MTKSELTDKLESILRDAKTGILATVDADGNPRMRWMTPHLMDGHANMLYSITSPLFTKIDDLNKSPYVQWMIQTRDLREVITLRGRISIIDNPSFKAQMIEKIGSKLTVFWKLNKETTDWVVLETVINEAVYFSPMKGIKETVEFTKGA
jgi:general stress protein 26